MRKIFLVAALAATSLGLSFSTAAAMGSAPSVSAPSTPVSIPVAEYTAVQQAYARVQVRYDAAPQDVKFRLHPAYSALLGNVSGAGRAQRLGNRPEFDRFVAAANAGVAELCSALGC